MSKLTNLGEKNVPGKIKQLLYKARLCVIAFRVSKK